VASTYALYASASFHDQVVEESFVHSGKPVQIGNSPTLAIPVPEGLPYVARVLWTGPSSCAVQDGAGGSHHLEPGNDVVIELGPVSLRLYVVEQFRIRRAQPWSARGSIAWLAIFLMSMVVTSQAAWIDRHQCKLALTFMSTEMVQQYYWHCLPQQANAGRSGMTAEYLARLLREDLDGEEIGVVENELDRPEQGAPIDREFMPAGHIGPATSMGGAEDTAPEPIRSPREDEIPLPRKAEDEVVPLFAEDVGTPIPLPPEEAVDPEDGVADGIDSTETEDDAVEPPAEEEEGWGIPDWYDQRDEAMDNVEIELMLRVAQRRLKIDADDPSALMLLSYYQYLAEDYSGATTTYDHFIELYPEDAAGYNNKALIYKRKGEYQKEEGLYRVALSYSEFDETAINNLAVNLSHQGRFEEALTWMAQLEAVSPDDPYAHLHRSKIYAEMGNDEQALVYLRKALEGMAALDTLHHIEFRQDIRLDPSFESLRQTRAFRAILDEFYGSDTPLQE